jgi:hypothetical protein
VTILEKGNKYQGFRYPNLETGVLADLRWTREVAEQLMRAVEPLVEACSTPGPPIGFRITETFTKPGEKYAVIPGTKGSAKRPHLFAGRTETVCPIVSLCGSVPLDTTRSITALIAPCLLSKRHWRSMKSVAYPGVACLRSKTSTVRIQSVIRTL